MNQLGELSAQLVRRSLGIHDDTMYVNLHETHSSYIRHIVKSTQLRMSCFVLYYLKDKYL